MNCLSIKRIWSDIHCIELQISARTDLASSTIKVYVNESDIEELKDAFEKFPKSKNDTFEWVIGSKADDSPYFFRMKIFIYDKLGHAAIEIETDNRQEIPLKATAHFYIPTEIGSINSLGRKLKDILQDDYTEVEGIAFCPK